jgi:hypothetical protein
LAKHLLQLAANLFELTGVMMMAGSLLSAVPFWQWPRVLFFSIWRPGSADAKIAEVFGREAKRTSLRGLAFISVGFLLQVLIVIFADLLPALG